MNDSPTPSGSLMLLLQTIVDGQKSTSSKLDAALERMATKEDVMRIVDAQDKFASKLEVDELRADVEELKAQRLPRWVLTLVGCVAAVVAAVSGHLIWR